MPSAAPLGTIKLKKRVFHGTLIHSLSLTEIEYLENALLGVDEHGVIAFLDNAVSSAADVDQRLEAHGWSRQDAQVVEMKRGEFLMPGLIDTHTHAPQYLNLGYGQQYELLDWLDNLTFPAEAKFADASYARRVYDSVVERVISTGTTTCCWYGTIHATTKLLAAVCHRRGQRAFVGKCNMDRNSADYYQEESAQKSLEATEDYVSWVRTHCDSPSATATQTAAPSKTPRRSTALVQPILTPRFAISCSDVLMSGLGDMMDRDPDLPLQTHLAENPAEVEFALSLYPGIESYTAAYDRFRLLRPNTVLAHCVFLSSLELDLIKARQSGISHCANSNFNLRSGTARVADMLDKGIKVSLGTDNSGGTAIGILSAIRSASTCSKTIIFHERNQPKNENHSSSKVVNVDGISRPSGFFASTHLSVETLFYLATLGGAQVCNLEDRIGNFVVGKEFDALLVHTGQKEPAFGVVAGMNGAANGGGAELLLEDELEKALAGGESVLENGVENPALMLESDEGIERVFEKFLFTGDDRNLRAVFVRGRQIGGRETL
ncbi:Metallo-dependent hydrolase [Rhodotorula sp. JG-1b]|nr:Metallo-dependent hydrolase [Rhodotorula sp. JG-1b]